MLRRGEHTAFRYAHLPTVEKLMPSSVAASGGTVLQVNGRVVASGVPQATAGCGACL